MRASAEAWPEKEFVQQAIAQLPWGHQTRFLDHITEYQFQQRRPVWKSGKA
jgi:hypothetical protein